MFSFIVLSYFFVDFQFLLFLLSLAFIYFSLRFFINLFTLSPIPSPLYFNHLYLRYFLFFFKLIFSLVHRLNSFSSILFPFSILLYCFSFPFLFYILSVFPSSFAFFKLLFLYLFRFLSFFLVFLLLLNSFSF